ncbi:LCP family protein [bacterium]|nr:LCP family protein [bacterium]
MNNLSEKHDEKIRNNRILLFGIIVSVVIGTIGFALGMKGINRDILMKDMQINSMIDEIGQIKQENQYLYQNLLLNRNAVTESFKILHNSFEEFSSKGEKEIAVLSDRFAKAKDDLKAAVIKNDRLAKEIGLQNYPEDIFTILILGTNQNLTDTIVLAVVNPSKKTITLVSIPRDLYVNGRKINEIYSAYGIRKFKQDITRISGVRIDKYIIISLESFKKVIDILGGIDLYVYKNIVDPYFPTAENGYKEYSIKKGSHHMNGNDALMYVRSRKTTNDFDRSKRQHQVIQAVRVKVKMLDLLSSIDKAIEIYKTIARDVKTNIDVFEALSYLKNYQNYAIESGNVISTSNFLYSTKNSRGQYILLPKAGDYLNIKQSISTLIRE